jgi:hypothetical protein
MTSASAKPRSASPRANVRGLESSCPRRTASSGSSSGSSTSYSTSINAAPRGLPERVGGHGGDGLALKLVSRTSCGIASGSSTAWTPGASSARDASNR